MPQPADLTGERFGQLVVTEFAGVIKTNRYWYCICDCGNETMSHTSHLRAGKAQSCGCVRNAPKKHGGRLNGDRTPEYRAWIHIRVNLPHDPSWESFSKFFRDVGWRPDDTYQLDRYDIHQPHGPENTYWRNPNDEREQRINTDIGEEFFIDLTGVREADAFAGAAN